MLEALKKKLVSLVANDAALGALLSSADAIYHRRPPRELALPCLTFSLADRPDADSAGYGKLLVELSLNAWSASGDTNDDIVAALDDLLYDAHRQGTLDTTAFRAAACRRAWSKDEGDAGIRSADGHEVQRRSTLWHIVLLEKQS